MNDLLQEIWNDIQGYEGLYQVSNFGRVKSLPKKHDISMGKGYYITKERILQPGEDKDGYLQVGLRKNKKTKMRKIHRLVAETFIPNLNNLPQVNHKDENKQNNDVINLEWCNNSYNQNYGTCGQKKSESMKGFRHTEETKRKMSEARRGEKNYFYGKHHTEESKNKLSKANKGRKTSEETKKKLSEVTKGSKNPRAKKVRCIETGQVFDYIREANEFLGKNRLSSDISKCCKGKLKTCGGLSLGICRGGYII